MLSALKSAIESRVPISFHQIKAGKDPGERIGNPHAIYIGKTSEGVTTTMIDIAQTGGVSDSQKQNPFPSFRTFYINELSNVALKECTELFEQHHAYNPTSKRYDSVIIKV